jgi:hypothetical protein
MKTASTWFLVGMMSVVVAGMAIVGCESTKSTTDAITLTPASATLTNASSVTFVATLGNTNINAVLPLVWSVNDESLGHIEGRGMTAVYTPTDRHGNNNIKVRDQADGEGIAVVNQEATPSRTIAENTIVVSPATVSLGAGVEDDIVFTASLNSDTVLPLTWTLTLPALGYIVSTSDSPVHTVKIHVYDRPGTNVVVVQDAGFGTGSAAIAHK